MPYQEQEFPIIILAYFVNAIADELEIEAMQLAALLLERRNCSARSNQTPVSTFSIKL
jgi:hypothetical protein